MMLTQFAPIRHDEVTSFRDDRIHSNILQNLGNVISLSLEINRNGFEISCEVYERFSWTEGCYDWAHNRWMSNLHISKNFHNLRCGFNIWQTHFHVIKRIWQSLENCS